MLTEISTLISSVLREEIESGLILAAEVFERSGSAKEGSECGDGELIAIRDALCGFVSSSADDSLKATAVWALGKLYDPSLVPFLTQILKVSVPDGNALIYQSLVALSNVGVIRFPDGSGTMFDIEANRLVAIEYLDRV